MELKVGDIVINPAMPQWGLGEVLTVAEGKAMVRFDVDSKGLGPINMELAGFELAGNDGVYYPATGKVDSKDRRIIVVSCPEVSSPVAVRYAMKNWSTATVFSNFGIPASPFKAELK
mgnify:CR=1 FL=1